MNKNSEWMLNAADEISFMYESYYISQRELPSFSEISAVIKKWQPFLETTEGVTLSVERYNELIAKEISLSRVGVIQVNTDGSLVE